MWCSRQSGSVSLVLAELAHHWHTGNAPAQYGTCDTFERNVPSVSVGDWRDGAS